MNDDALLLIGDPARLTGLTVKTEDRPLPLRPRDRFPRRPQPRRLRRNLQLPRRDQLLAAPKDPTRAFTWFVEALTNTPDAAGTART